MVLEENVPRRCTLKELSIVCAFFRWCVGVWVRGGAGRELIGIKAITA